MSSRLESRSPESRNAVTRVPGITCLDVDNSPQIVGRCPTDSVCYLSLILAGASRKSVEGALAIYGGLGGGGRHSVAAHADIIPF